MRLGRDGGGRDVACDERDPSDVEVVNPRLAGGPRVRTCRRGAGESCVKGGEEAMREEGGQRGLFRLGREEGVVRWGWHRSFAGRYCLGR